MLQKVLKSWVYLERKWATLSARRQGWRRKGKTTLFEAKYVSILEISISSKLNHSRHFMHCIYMYFHPAVTNASAEHQGRLLWITCKWLKLLRKASDSKFSAASMWHPNWCKKHHCDWSWKVCIQIHWINSLRKSKY